MLDVKVIYPPGNRRIVLRTDSDWETDVSPVRVHPSSGISEFRLPVDRPYAYFKPVLVEPGGDLRWAKGENHLALSVSGLGATPLKNPFTLRVSGIEPASSGEARLPGRNGDEPARPGLDRGGPGYRRDTIAARPDRVEGERGKRSCAGRALPPALCYPFFYEEPQCSVCTLLEAPGLSGALGHRFRVFLPPGYHENTLQRYPVLYMHDGQNLFLEEEAFLGSAWKADKILDQLTAMTAIEPVIVVGIFPNEREREYTRPGYDAYARFLIGRLKPLIDRTHRTKPGPRTTAVMGSSLGGVASFYLGWQHPDVFGQVACLSSTFGWRDDLMDRVAREPRRPIRIYLDSGWPGDNYEVTLAMRERLLASGYAPGGDLLHVSFPHAAHNEAAWSARSHVPYQFLFGR